MMAKSAAEIWDNVFAHRVIKPYATAESAKQEALKQLHDEVIEGLPKKRAHGIKSEYQHCESKNYNQALDDVTKFIDSYFKGTA